MAKTNPITTLAEQLVRTLRELRDRGAEAYPTTRTALAALAAPQASAEDLAKAFKKKPISGSFLLAHKSDPQCPIMLTEDAERLASSALLLEFALNLICTPQKPAHLIAAVVKKIDKVLQPTFAAALERRLNASDWPDSVGVVAIKNKPHLYLKRLPPPPPPPVVLLATRLLETLQRLKQAGSYPTTVSELLQRSDPAASPEIIRKALKEKTFKPHVVIALTNHLDSPLALVADASQLAASSLLLETVVAALRTASNQVLPAAGLEKKLDKSLRQPFAENLVRRLESKSLPPGVGCLHIKAKPHLFLWTDAGYVLVVPETSSPTPKRSDDFTQRFDDAFTRLDREKGGSNFVSLVALRRAIPVERIIFDVGLDELRRAGRYTLSSAEGRHGVSDEELDAGIREEGALLLYVSRKKGE